MTHFSYKLQVALTISIFQYQDREAEQTLAHSLTLAYFEIVFIFAIHIAST